MNYQHKYPLYYKSEFVLFVNQNYQTLKVTSNCRSGWEVTEADQITNESENSTFLEFAPPSKLQICSWEIVQTKADYNTSKLGDVQI